MDNLIFPNRPLDSSSGRIAYLVYQSADYEYQVEISIIPLGDYRFDCHLLV
jgi:hypothetical protein